MHAAGQAIDVAITVTRGPFVTSRRTVRLRRAAAL